MCLAVSVSKIDPLPDSRRLWLLNEPPKLHPLAKVCLNSWFPDHKETSLPWIYYYLYYISFPINFKLFCTLCPGLNPELTVSAGIFWELRAVLGTETIFTFSYFMLSIWLWSIFVWNFTSVQEPVLNSLPESLSPLWLCPWLRFLDGKAEH